MWRRVLGQLHFSSGHAAWRSLQRRHLHRAPLRLPRISALVRCVGHSHIDNGLVASRANLCSQREDGPLESEIALTTSAPVQGRACSSGSANDNSRSSGGSGGSNNGIRSGGSIGDSSSSNSRSTGEHRCNKAVSLPTDVRPVRGVLRDAAAHGDREHALSAVRNLQKAGVAAVQDWSDRVQALVKTGNVHRAVSYLSGLVERGHQPNINAFHFVLEPLSRKRILSTSLIVVALMRQCGTPLDTKAYHYALGACGGQHAMQHADQLLREMKAAGVAADQHTFAAAAHACIVSKKWQRALDLFAEIEADYPHLVTVGMWNRLLRVLIRTGQPEQAIAKGAEMVERGLKLNSETFSYLLGAHARLADQTQITALTSAVRAAGVRVTHACRFQIIEGYALTGHLQLAEEALEAAVQSGQARPDMIMAIVSGCRLVGDASRAQRWLQRSLSLGLTPSAATWHMAIETAQEGGDEGAADALWHDAEAAGALSFYKVMRRNKEGVLIVDLDRTSVLRQPLKSALDVSRCNVVLAHAALRAAARELAQMPPPAIRYICTGAFNPKQHAAAKALAEIMQDAGAQVSREAGTGGLWKVTMPRRTR